LEDLKQIKHCELCGHKNLQEVLNIGNHPLCDDLIPINSNRQCTSYPITILLCQNCLTAHQKFQIRKEILFPLNYHYRARFTKDVLNGMENLVNDCEKFLHTLQNVKVLDVGCNDGSLLNFFKKKGSFTVGIEPTKASMDATEAGHKIYNEFFDARLAEKVFKQESLFDVVVFTNVFAHIDDLKNLLLNIKKVLKKDGLLIIENHYLGSVLKGNQFDTFYHEHPRTYSALSFIHIAKILGLKLTDFKFTSRYGGNIRVFISNKENYNKDFLDKTIKNEKETFECLFLKMNKFINTWKTEINSKLKNIIKKNGPLVAKAFPGRAAILIHLLGYDQRDISVVYEKPNSLKIDHFVPGTRIPIKSEKELFEKKEKHTHLLNLAWHIPDEIDSYMKENKFEGKIINILE
jgi:SAM-dependent methyltransferase